MEGGREGEEEGKRERGEVYHQMYAVHARDRSPPLNVSMDALVLGTCTPHGYYPFKWAGVTISKWAGVTISKWVCSYMVTVAMVPSHPPLHSIHYEQM
jgi:hypothetical protein